MLLFLTRPSSTPHQVLRVHGDSPRFGFTGWYLTPGDGFTPYELAQNLKMGADANKFGQCV
eukprot:5771595-Prymnesium_polylepis.1